MFWRSLGHWGDHWGVTHHDGWLDGTDNYGERMNWILTCDRPGEVWFKQQGQNRKVVHGGSHDAPSRLHIRWGTNEGEVSDWEFAELAMYRRTLSSEECEENFRYYKEKFGIR